MPIKTETKVELVPDSLLVSPCSAVEAGQTVGSLAKAYIINTKCIYAYSELLQEIRLYNQKVKEIYGK